MLKYHPRTFRTDTHQTAQKLSAFGVHAAELLSFFMSCRFWYYLLWFIRCHQHWWVISIQWFIYCHFASMFISRLYFSSVVHSFFLFYLFCSLLTFWPIVADVVALYLRVVYDVPSTQHRLQTLPFWFDIVSLINGLTAPALCSLWANNKQFK